MSETTDDRKNLAAKLERVDNWVALEFQFLDEILIASGCEPRLESGPGAAYRLDGDVVARLHPKQRHLAIGLPEELRAEVDGLNRRTRLQQGAAWLDYEPGVCDRATIERLLAVVQPGTSPTHVGPQAAEPDAVDLRLILDVLRAHRAHQDESGRPMTVKVLRELIFSVWEAPRLPAGGKYSRDLPHSPQARARRLRGERGGLVFEHVHPINLVIRGLLANVPDDAAALRAVLEASADRVIITKEEDQQLVAAGVRSGLAGTDDPWQRYASIGLAVTDFAPCPPLA